MMSDFEPGDVVRLKSGSPPMTVARTFVDDRFPEKKQYASIVYFNPATGEIVKNVNFAFALLELTKPKGETFTIYAEVGADHGVVVHPRDPFDHAEE